MSDPTNEPEGWDTLGASWRSASPGASSFEDVDPAVVRTRADAFARSIRWRNVREVVAGTIVVVAGARTALHSSSLLVSIGGASMALGAVSVTAVIVTRARNAAPPPSDAPTRAVLAFERAELDRQARLLERVWLWYLAPFLPSLVAIYAAALLSALEKGENRGVIVSLGLFVGSLGFLGAVGWVNTRAARRLRAQMALLPAENAGSLSDPGT
jgi:hypothetical protein